GHPTTVAPGRYGWASACARAATAGARVSDAVATAALSMTRLMIIAVTSSGTGTGSVASSAIFQASCSSRGRFAALGWTRTSWVTSAGMVLLSPAGPSRVTGYGHRAAAV